MILASARKRFRTSLLLDQLSASTWTATGTSRSSSLPSHTVANDPAPMRRTSRYRPMESIATILTRRHAPASRPRRLHGSRARREGFERGSGALGVQGVECVQVRLGERRLSCQITEQLAVLDECERVVPLLGGKALHCIGQLIVYFDRLTLLIYPFGVAGPTRNHSCRQRHIATSCKILPDYRNQPRGNALRTPGTEPSDRVPDRRIGESLDELQLVRVEINARYRGKCRRSFAIHVIEQEVGEQGILRDLVHQPVAGEIAEVAQGLVTRVQQP